MILQGIELTRFLSILITQSFIIFFFLYLAFKILKRNLNYNTLTLSFFYILPAIGFVLGVIFLPFSTTLAGYILYFIAAFLIIFGPVFLEIFILNLLKIEPNFKSKKHLIIIFTYAMIIFVILILPDGITINENTNWAPVFSWSFLIFLYITFTIMILIPSIILSIKLYKRLEDRNLRKKFRYFFLGVIGMYTLIYGLVLYNTWDNPIFKTIWFFLSLVAVPSGILIYYGIGQNL